MNNYDVHDDMAEFFDESPVEKGSQQYACECDACLAGDFDACENGWS